MAERDTAETAARGADRGLLRASHADREQAIATLKVAFMQGRLTAGELAERAGQAYAAKTYAQLAEVTADIPAGRAPARPRRDPWRATKIACWIEYAVMVPGIFSLMALKGPDTTRATVIIVPTVLYLVFWTLGILVMVAARSAKRTGGNGDDTPRR